MIMVEYKLTNGYVLTNEEIEARAKEWEDGTWKGQLVELRHRGQHGLCHRQVGWYRNRHR